MSEQHPKRVEGRQRWAWVAALCLAAAVAAGAQQAPPADGAKKETQAQGQGGAEAGASGEKKETHITPDQAKQLFALVDELIKFSSQETGLAIKSDVMRKITSRAEVEGYL